MYGLEIPLPAGCILTENSAGATGPPEVAGIDKKMYFCWKIKADASPMDPR